MPFTDRAAVRAIIDAYLAARPGLVDLSEEERKELRAGLLMTSGDTNVALYDKLSGAVEGLPRG